MEAQRINQKAEPLNVSLLVPYSLSATHGNCVRVKQMLACNNQTSYSVFSYDLPWTRPKSASISFALTLKAAYNRIVRRLPITDLLVCEEAPKNLVKHYSQTSKEFRILQAENLWAIPIALKAKSGEQRLLATLHDVYSDRIRELLTYFGADAATTERIVQRVELLEEELIPKLDACVFVSQTDLERYRKLVSLPPTSAVIPNGVDTRQFVPLPKKEAYIRKYGLQYKQTILFAGSDMYQNRQAVDNAIKVFKKLGDNRYQLVVTGSVSGYAKQQARKHAVSIIALGYVEDINEIYSIVDLVFIPLSTGTGTKLKVLEAMACGKPVITTTRGIRGFDVEKACIIADEEHEQIAQIRELLANPEKATELGREARKTALGFDWKSLMANYLDVYFRILG